jgi:hypothetical protein
MNRADEGSRGKTTMKTKGTIGTKEDDSKSFGKWRLSNKLEKKKIFGKLDFPLFSIRACPHHPRNP